jgi:hypothetical protein
MSFGEQRTNTQPLGQRQLDLRLLAQRGTETKLSADALHSERM